MDDLKHRGHTVQERYIGEGVTFYLVVEHGDGLVGGRGCHGSRLAARASIDECCDSGRVECSLRQSTRIDELLADRAQVRQR